MLFRAAFTTTAILIGLAGSETDLHAQAHLGRDYLPAQGFYGQPTQSPSYREGQGDSAVDQAVPPQAGASGRDRGVTGSYQGQSGSFAGLPAEVRPESGPAKELPVQFRRTLVDYATQEP